MSTTKAYAVDISGSYFNSKGEVIDYVTKGVIPMTGSEELAIAAVRNRYAQMWISQDPKYPERILGVREVFIDNIEETEAEFSFIGKNITDMTYEEIQDVATAKDLREVPLYKSGGLREAQGRLYAAYANKVMGMSVDWREAGYNVMKQPALTVDATPKASKTKKLTNEEVLAKEQENVDGGKAKFSRAELEQLAKDNGITFNAAISDEKLYEKVFGNSKPASSAAA